MLNVRTRNQTYQVNGSLDTFQNELADKSQQYINIKGELLKKSEILAVRQAESQKPMSDPFQYENTLTQAERAENIYVFTYMKAKIPRYMKSKGSRLDNDEVRALIQEARVSYRDTTV